jgi:aldose 1-epimerase
LGWHPYFKIYNRAESKLRFNSFQKLESNDENITTGIKPLKTPNPLFLDNVCLDDAFILEDNNVGFETHEYNANLTFSYPSNYLQLYTPTHSNSIAIEPMTGISDSFNNGIGLKKLKAGEKFNVNWLLKISTNPNQHE